jgi:hypothetical protein
MLGALLGTSPSVTANDLLPAHEQSIRCRFRGVAPSQKPDRLHERSEHETEQLSKRADAVVRGRGDQGTKVQRGRSPEKGSEGRTGMIAAPVLGLFTTEPYDSCESHISTDRTVRLDRDHTDARYKSIKPSVELWGVDARARDGGRGSIHRSVSRKHQVRKMRK